MKTVRLYNTLSRKEELFVPQNEGLVKLYSCGPTVYHYAHLGNLRGYIVTDTVRRVLIHAGYTVKAVINITDVGHNVGDVDDAEDKMERGAKREGKSAYDIARMYTDAYFSDLDALLIPREAYSFPRATETIEEQIDLVSKLLTEGHAYTLDDGIYFDTSTFPSYRDLAKLDVDGLKAGARVEVATGKRSITDFALWKFSPKGSRREMEWESPWGTGFPGWHIECSAMSKKILGPHLDIHMGGIDHIPVHHTNEIAQSECANGEKYVNYWLHYNFLNDKEGKMAKSNGDFLRLQSIIDAHVDPLAYKYYVLLTHYRSEIHFSFEALQGAAVAYRKLKEFFQKIDSAASAHEGYMREFEQALFLDFNTPKAIGVLWTMVKDESLSLETRKETLFEMDAVLGLGLTKVSVQEELPEEVRGLLEERLIAKNERNYGKADELRAKIESLGYSIIDSQNGSQAVKK